MSHISTYIYDPLGFLLIGGLTQCASSVGHRGVIHLHLSRGCGLIPNDLIRFEQIMKSQRRRSNYRHSSTSIFQEATTIQRVQTPSSSKLVQEHRSMKEVDLNPIILREKGACVVDAKILLRSHDLPTKNKEKYALSARVRLRYNTHVFAGNLGSDTSV